MIKIVNRVVMSVGCLISKTGMGFSWEQQVKQLKNINIKFELENWNLVVYPMHPQIVKNKNGAYQVRATSHVLNMFFVPQMEGMSFQQAWKQRKNFNLRFSDLGKLLYVIPGSLRQEIITRTTKQQLPKHFLIKDLGKESKKIEFQIKAGNIQDKSKPLLVAKIQYLDYSVLHTLIKSSLCDLSGWSFAIDLQQRKMLGEIVDEKRNKKNQLKDLTQE